MLALTGVPGVAARLTPEAELAFQQYVAGVEARIERQHARPETYVAMLASERELRIEPVNGGSWSAGGALLHHWRGAAFVPQATPKEMLALVRDFSHFPEYYAPEIVSASALVDDGENATLAVRLKERRIVTIVLDAEYQVHGKLQGEDRGYSISRSTHIWEVDDPGSRRERRRPEGDDDGFLWHLNSYWSFVRVPGGLLIECEAVSLTRDVPAGLGWLAAPVIDELPRTALEFTLRSTKKALEQHLMRRPNDE